jgi:hypothetical protein
MLRTFDLTLGNVLNKKTLKFDILSSSIAQRWAAEINKKYPFYENDRFTNWPSNTKSESYYEAMLLLHINVIKDYGYNIDITNLNFQNALNALHKHFEDLRGHVDYPSEWYKTAPRKVKNSVDKLNLYIHEYENLLEEKKQNFRNPTIVCTFEDRPKYKLEESDYQHFTHRWEHGTVYINYCEVGKPLLDVFKDNDHHVGKDAIRPQSTWSADFMIKFGPTVPESVAAQKDKDFLKWYNENNFDFKQKSLGYIPVAKINSSVDISKLKKFDKVADVSCRE